MEYRLQTDGLTEVQGRLRDLIRRGNDMRKPLRVVERMMREDAKDLFKTEGGSGAHGKWTPRKAGKGRKRRRGKILQRTRALRRAVTTERGAGRQTIITSRDLTIRITLAYAAVHHYGLGRMPRRRIIDPTAQQLARYMDVLVAWLTTQDLSRYRRTRRSAGAAAP